MARDGLPGDMDSSAMTRWGNIDTNCEVPSLEVRLTAAVGTGAKVAGGTDGGMTEDVLKAGVEKD